eukprot:766896-Hanusia_phi.AAC.3
MASAMHVEAQRLTACVEDAVDKLSRPPPPPASSSDLLLAVLAMLETDGSHAELIQMRSDEAGRLLGDLVQRRGRDADMPSPRSTQRPDAHVSERNRHEEATCRRLSHSIQCQRRKDQEHCFLAQTGNLSKIRRTCESVTEILSQTINELESGKFDTVRIKVEKEGEWRNHIMNTIAREKELSEKTSELRDNLAHERMEMSRIITMKDETIADLKVREDARAGERLKLLSAGRARESEA